MKDTRLMRVPNKYYNQVKDMTKRYNYPSMTSFLKKEGTTILQNVDTINRLFKPVMGIFGKGKFNVKKQKK